MKLSMTENMLTNLQKNLSGVVIDKNAQIQHLFDLLEDVEKRGNDTDDSLKKLFGSYFKSLENQTLIVKKLDLALKLIERCSCLNPSKNSTPSPS